jgi:hypothetical protein
VYVDGYYRTQARVGWSWADGRYMSGRYIPGTWQPNGSAPSGYQWEAGFFDGAVWVDGFWRPSHRVGYQWTAATLDSSGVFSHGYWEPMQRRPGMTWVPGWYDGARWTEGYWTQNTSVNGAETPYTAGTYDTDLPLAIPVQSGGIP